MNDNEREKLLGRMLELLKEPGDVRKTEFVERAKLRLGLSRHATRSLLDEAIVRGLVSESRRYSATSTDRSSLFLVRTDVPFVPKGVRPDADRAKSPDRGGSVSLGVERLPVAEVWMDLPDMPVPYQVSNYGRMRKVVLIADDTGMERKVGCEALELKRDRDTGRFGWMLDFFGERHFVGRDEMLGRFVGIRCIVNPVDEIDALVAE